MGRFPQRLIDGYRDFINNSYQQEKINYQQLADEGQKPETMVIACCDSRATPENIFSAKAGELFIVRNVANLVPPYDPDGGRHGTSAAIEFAVLGLKVKNIVIMGHGRCGGIQAALTKDFQPLEKGDFISKWIDMVKPLANEVNIEEKLDQRQKQRRLEELSIINSLANLHKFPYIKRLVNDGELNLFGAWFDIRDGKLMILNEAGKFSPIL